MHLSLTASYFLLLPDLEFFNDSHYWRSWKPQISIVATSELTMYGRSRLDTEKRDRLWRAEGRNSPSTSHSRTASNQPAQALLWQIPCSSASEHVPVEKCYLNRSFWGGSVNSWPKSSFYPSPIRKELIIDKPRQAAKTQSQFRKSKRSSTSSSTESSQHLQVLSLSWTAWVYELWSVCIFSLSPPCHSKCMKLNQTAHSAKL